MKPNIFTIPAGSPFLLSLARAILAGALPAPGAVKPAPHVLPNITLLLPTRRAARAAREAFLAASGQIAIVMPRIRPISEGDDDLAQLISLSELGPAGADALELPPAISTRYRILVLMQLVERWSAATASSEGVARSTPAQAAHLAVELAKLMDDVERENVSLAEIHELVPEQYSEHWQKTVEFLKIVTEFWPQYLSASGLMAPEARRNACIMAEAARVAKLPVHEAVIVAGVTGSIPATVELMRAVAGRANGAIVLPALDKNLDEDSWQAIVPNHPEHPQFGLKKLIDALGVPRTEVRAVAGSEIDGDLRVRASLFSEAMRPSATTAKWHDYVTTADRHALTNAMSNVSVIAAPTAQDEAEVVALILREAVETPRRTAALVSPDRLLARRVAIRLETWGIRVDDSAGRPFAKTVPGTFLALVIGAVASDFAPAATMALLKHPLCRLGLSTFDVRRFGRALEILAFRTAYLGKGLGGIRAALENAAQSRSSSSSKRQTRAARRLWQEDVDSALALVEAMRTAFEPLLDAYASGEKRSLADLARAHATTAEAAAALPAEDTEGEASSVLWQGAAGEAASTFFSEILAADAPQIEMRAADYADFVASLLARDNVREREAVHPRISIWGPLEARLQQPDVLVMGSLNEGTWPEAADTGAWLNRPMRERLGLPSPEQEIGRSAHDFVSLLGSGTLYLTRAERVEGAPTVPSRWLMRIAALLEGLGLQEVVKPTKPWLAWARARDAVAAATPIRAPAPTPPVDQRPRKLSVTEIERWMANPYAIYARHILKLEPLPELGASPDASLRGGLVHEVLAQFANAFAHELPVDALAELEGFARKTLVTYTGHPRVAAFWLPRLMRFLRWFAASEDARRAGTSKVIAETSGSLVLPGPAGAFTLTARADRIDEKGDSIVITDYKTGGIPSDEAVKDGRSPQLPLEAAIALSETGFPHLVGKTIEGLRYIRASGGEPAGSERIVRTDDPAALAEKSRLGLERLIARFAERATPYRALRRPAYRYDYDDYAHLARVAEWSAHVDEEIPI